MTPRELKQEEMDAMSKNDEGKDKTLMDKCCKHAKHGALTALRSSESGIVDVVLTVNEEGRRFVKRRIRLLRIPQTGDKFVSRHGQKHARHDVPRRRHALQSQGHEHQRETGAKGARADDAVKICGAEQAEKGRLRQEVAAQG